jgi:hypothetical protein
MWLGLHQSAMRPSLYRHGVVLPVLELCFPQNKGLRNKIGLDINFLETIRSRQSDRASLAAPSWPKINRQHTPPPLFFGELQRSKKHTNNRILNYNTIIPNEHAGYNNSNILSNTRIIFLQISTIQTLGKRVPWTDSIMYEFPAITFTILYGPS